jgi:hypothetical protein
MASIPKFRVYNATDGIYASPEEFSADEAVSFMGSFRARFKDSGYRTSHGQTIGHHDIELKVERASQNAND